MWNRTTQNSSEIFETLRLRIRKFADENIIIGGDMNCCLTPKDERGGWPTEQKKLLIDSILRVMKKYFNLVDLWRKFHPNESHFTCSITCYQLFSVGLITGWCQNIYLHKWKNGTSFPFRSPITRPSLLTSSPIISSKEDRDFSFQYVPWWSVLRGGVEKKI